MRDSSSSSQSIGLPANCWARDWRKVMGRESLTDQPMK